MKRTTQEIPVRVQVLDGDRYVNLDDLIKVAEVTYDELRALPLCEERIGRCVAAATHLEQLRYWKRVYGKDNNGNSEESNEGGQETDRNQEGGD